MEISIPKTRIMDFQGKLLLATNILFITELQNKLTVLNILVIISHVKMKNMILKEF
jgi:hypothetical protein